MKALYRLIRNLFVFLTVLLLLGIFAVVRPIIFSVNPVPLTIKADPDKLRSHVKKISEEYYPRNWQNPENLNKAAKYIKDELAAHNAEVSLQKFEVESLEFANVISKYGVNDQPGIIVGAHYDAFSTLPGADDNASGVAGLLELGRLLTLLPVKIPVTLVAYSLEEPPFFRSEAMGSAFHATSLEKNNTKIRLMIALEMIGYFSEEEGSQDYPSSLMKLFYPTKGNFIAIIDKLNFDWSTINIKSTFLRSTSLNAVSINAPPILPGIDFSDHLNYWDSGYPAVMITDTAFYRNSAYHSESDVAERLDYQKMGEVVKGVYSYLSTLE